MTDTIAHHPETQGDDHSPAAERIGYFRFALQILTVALAYIMGAAILTAPALLMGEPTTERTSFWAALSSPAGALAGVFVAWLWLRKSGRFKEAMGLVPMDSTKRMLALAALATGVTIAIFQIGGNASEAMGLESPAVDSVIGLATASPALFALWIVGVAWIGAGFGEEVLWRGFLMDRLQHLPGIGGSMPVALVVQAIIFGLAHFYQGWSGVLITGCVGLLMGWIRLTSRGSIWAAVIAHGAVDTIMLSLAYAGELGWYNG